MDRGQLVPVVHHRAAIVEAHVLAGAMPGLPRVGRQDVATSRAPEPTVRAAGKAILRIGSTPPDLVGLLKLADLHSGSLAPTALASLRCLSETVAWASLAPLDQSP
ncbi:MAG TPA: hypothetical protein DEG43_06375 [Acidimicrobiaceae bacterium]|nr:hypothetical protein [Acidimicrobiaceae bacterium]